MSMNMNMSTDLNGIDKYLREICT